MSNYNATIISPKVNAKSGFTHYPDYDRAVIAGHVQAYLAKGGRIDVRERSTDVNYRNQISTKDH